VNTRNQHHTADVDTEPDVPAVIVTLETLSELADLVHRHRLAVAALKHELAELADELLLREAQVLLAVQGEGKNAEERKARQALMLAADADYQALRRRERDVRRQIAEREADIEKAIWRLRFTMQALPLAQAVDALAQEPDRSRAPEAEEAP
jgi:hypothetical protein